MRRVTFVLGLFAVFLFFPGLLTNLESSELVYRPINPSFAGGNPYNASWLLQSADMQNTFQDPNAEEEQTDGYSQDPIENFKDNLSRSILSRISNRVVNQVFGEDELNEGHYEIGDYAIDVMDAEQGVQIYIFDLNTGNETNIVVPYY